MTRSRGLEGGRTLLGNTRPALWLGVIVTSSFIVSTIGGLAFTQPIVFRDELVYSSAAKAVVHGPDGVSRFAYGAYPLLIAPIYALLGNVQHAYAAIKIANGAAFALAAVPAYLLARRVAPATLALGVALLTVLLPARVYSYLVFSESVAFLLFLLTVLSLVRVLEAPTRQREFLTFVLALLAVAVRRQNVVLFVVIPLATLIVVLAAREAPRGWLSRLKSDFAVTWLLLAGTAVAAAVWSGFGHSGFRGLLGPYAVLARSYDGGAVFTWLRVHVADLGPMFAVIPVATLPLALGHGLRRNAPPTARALSAVTLAALTALLVEVAAFSSTPYGLHRIHERYLFYAAPLVFAMFALWTQSGCDTRVRLAIAAGVTALLPLLLPRHGIVVDGLDTPVLFALDFHPDSAGSHGAVAPIAVSAYLAAALVLARPRLRPALIVLLAAGLLIVDVRLHRAVADRANVLATRALGTASRSDANWIDRAIGSSKPVTALYVAPAASCPHAADDVARAQAIYQRTEFFNSRVVRVALIGPDPDAGVPQSRLRLAGGGHAPRPGNGPTRVRYVVADARIALVGRVTAREPATGLALWAVDGVIRPRRPSTLDALASAVCRP